MEKNEIAFFLVIAEVGIVIILCLLILARTPFKDSMKMAEPTPTQTEVPTATPTETPTPTPEPTFTPTPTPNAIERLSEEKKHEGSDTE